MLDRQQGGKELLEEKGYRVHTLFTISEICDILKEENKLSEDEIERIQDFLAGNVVKFEDKARLTYEQKLEQIDHPAAKKLVEIAIEKKSNLIASADVVTTQELLDFAKKAGPHIVALKTHIDAINDFDYEKTIKPLKEIASEYNFLLMEDRKFGDIGSTQELQYSYGVYKISTWADLITSHVIGGYQSLDFFRNSGVIAILSMSSKGTLTTSEYFEEAQKIALQHPNVIGGVSQKMISDDLLLFTSGVSLEDSGDGKGQQYRTPELVFKNLHTDFMIVGRGIYKANDVEKAALHYKISGWEAYSESLSQK